LNSPFSPKRLPIDGEGHVFSPDGPWATVVGLCRFDEPADVREFPGDKVKISTASNSEPVPVLVPEVVGEYKTQGFHWNMRYRVRDFTRDEVIQMFVAAGVDMDWALEQMTVQITGPPVEIPPCTDITMRFSPSFRSVSLRPVFKVMEFNMDHQPYWNEWFVDTVVLDRTTWRDWGPEWKEIFSSQYQITGIAEILTGNQLESVAGVVDYSFERQPQCP
jgi:hypothetical protein